MIEHSVDKANQLIKEIQDIDYNISLQEITLMQAEVDVIQRILQDIKWHIIELDTSIY